jgi:hypothetical protein
MESSLHYRCSTQCKIRNRLVCLEGVASERVSAGSNRCMSTGISDEACDGSSVSFEVGTPGCCDPGFVVTC